MLERQDLTASQARLAASGVAALPSAAQAAAVLPWQRLPASSPPGVVGGTRTRACRGCR